MILRNPTKKVMHLSCSLVVQYLLIYLLLSFSFQCSFVLSSLGVIINQTWLMTSDMFVHNCSWCKCVTNLFFRKMIQPWLEELKKVMHVKCRAFTSIITRSIFKLCKMLLRKQIGEYFPPLLKTYYAFSSWSLSCFQF